MALLQLKYSCNVKPTNSTCRALYGSRIGVGVVHTASENTITHTDYNKNNYCYLSASYDSLSSVAYSNSASSSTCSKAVVDHLFGVQGQTIKKKFTHLILFTMFS